MTDIISRHYKMVFCDVDGTLLNSKNEISVAARQKIQELYSVNILFVLISARIPSGIMPIQRELGIKAPIICCSGALILDEHGGCVKSAGISREKAITINDFVKKEFSQISCGAFYCDTWIVDDINDKWVVQEQDITSTVAMEGEIVDIIPSNGCIHKFLCMGEAEHIQSLNKVLAEKYQGLYICRSKDTYLEIMSCGVSKSGAVKYLCDKYGVSIEDTVSFGDNFNDVDMLLATGIGFAMGNAPEEVKRQAHIITLDNDHDGVLEGLKQLNFARN